MGGQQYSHIIVTGCLRSGTTMLYYMLWATVEGYYFFSGEIHWRKTVGIPNIITKRSGDIFEYNTISQSEKPTCFIIIIRDIRDIMVSKHVGVKGYVIGWNKDFANQRGILDYYNDIKKIEGNSNVICIKYEDLIKSPNVIQNELCVKLGLIYNNYKFDEYYLNVKPQTKMLNNMHGLRKVDPNNVGLWKKEKHRQRVKEQFEACPKLFDVLIEHGYETDNAWFDIVK